MRSPRLVLIIVGVLLAGFVTGCTGAPAAPAGAVTQPAKASSTWDIVQADGHVIVGVGQEAAPFGYRAQNELVGFDIEIARAVVKRLEQYAHKPLTLEFKPVTDETRISWVQSGEVHMSLAHTNITRKRLDNIDFSVPYGWDGKGILYRTADGPHDLGELTVTTTPYSPTYFGIGVPQNDSRWRNMVNYALHDLWLSVVPLPLELLEVVGQAGRIAGETFAWAEPLLFAAGAHLLLSLGLDWLLNRWAAQEQIKIGVEP